MGGQERSVQQSCTRDESLAELLKLLFNDVVEGRIGRLGITHNVVTPHPDIIERLSELSDQARSGPGDHDRIGTGVRFHEDGPKWPRQQDWRISSNDFLKVGSRGYRRRA